MERYGSVMEDGGRRRRSGGEDWRFSRFSRSNPLGGKKVFGLADGESVWLVLIDRTCGGAIALETELCTFLRPHYSRARFLLGIREY